MDVSYGVVRSIATCFAALLFMVSEASDPTKKAEELITRQYELTSEAIKVMRSITNKSEAIRARGALIELGKRDSARLSELKKLQLDLETELNELHTPPAVAG